MSDSVPVPTVTVCRDCCCGSERKHPGVAHESQLETLRDGLVASGRVVVSRCLLVCDRSNVMVISPSPAARSRGAKPVWLTEMLAPEYTRAVIDWVRAGGPGIADIPQALQSRVEDKLGEKHDELARLPANPSIGAPAPAEN